MGQRSNRMTDPPPTHLTRQQKDAFKHARPPTRAPLTDKDKVRALLGPIRQKLAAGWSYEEVRQELARAVGFKGTRRTLYNYVWQLSSARATPPSPPSTAAQAVAEAPRPRPVEEAAPEPSRRHCIQNLGGPLAREANRQHAEDPLQRPSLVEILNKPL